MYAMPSYPGSIDSRLPQVGTTIFTEMSALAARHGAINLSQGFPDFGAPPELLALLADVARAGHNQYAPMTGVPALREAIAEQTERLYGARFDVDAEITVTAGATQAIFTAVACWVRPGDEVIVFEPVYDSYGPSVELNGGRVVPVRLTTPGYRPDWQAVRAAITPRTRMIIINTPHNPSGTVWSADDLRELDAIVRGTSIVVVSDEVYEHMVFDGVQHESVLRYPSLAERSFVVSSFGKTYHVTGWKIAYCLAPRELMAEFRKAHQFIVFTVHAPSQHALAAFMRNPGWFDELRALYQGKRDLFARGLRASRFELLPCQGTYFQCVHYRGVTGGVLGEVAGLGDRAFVEHLTANVGVAAIPLSAFYADGQDDGVIRFCFAKSEATLERALERLIQV
jgi:methionine aminotransferase